MSEINQHIGAVLRARRLQLGKSQQFIAEKVGISFQQLQKYEAGINSLAVHRALDLCEVLGINLTDLQPNGSTVHEVAALPISLAKNFHKLSEEGRKSVEALVRSLAKQSEA